MHFIVVTDRSLKERLSQGRWNSFIKESAATIVSCTDRESGTAERWGTIGVAIAMKNMVMAAWAQGMGSCWIGVFSEEEVKQFSGIPEDVKVVAFPSLGYPVEQPTPGEKKPLQKMVLYDRYE